MRVEDIIRAKGFGVSTIGPDEAAAKAATRLIAEGIGCLVVVDRDDRLLGLVTERDVVRAVVQHGQASLSRPVSTIMSTAVATCAPDDRITSAMVTVTAQRQRHLPVVDHGHLCGLVSIGDLVKARVETLELETLVLRDAYLAAH